MRLGYLSIRFKPSSTLFPQVKALYTELLALERGSGAADGSRRDGMQRTGEALVARLGVMGFASYAEFMQTMLAAELASHRGGPVRSVQPPEIGDLRSLPAGSRCG
jgi:hypothetical protein